MFLLSVLNIFAPSFKVSNVGFGQTNVSWVALFQGVGTKAYLQFFFQVIETCHMGTTTDVFPTFKKECSLIVFSFK